MSRLTITLTAAAASALVAAATVALPALGDEPRSPSSSEVAQLASCLRSHGLDGAPSTPETLKPWIAQRAAQDPQGVKAALNACKASMSSPKRVEPAERVDAQELAACLRSHGLDAPSDPTALKAWFQRMQTNDPDALDRVVPACKMQLVPEAGEKAKPGACGDDGAKGDDPAAKPEKPAETPEATT
jgi:hypothetical protein